MSIPIFTTRSRLIMIAPHPDDEALACSVILQQSVRAGTAIPVVYATEQSVAASLLEGSGG